MRLHGGPRRARLSNFCGLTPDNVQAHRASSFSVHIIKQDNDQPIQSASRDLFRWKCIHVIQLLKLKLPANNNGKIASSLQNEIKSIFPSNSMNYRQNVTEVLKLKVVVVQRSASCCRCFSSYLMFLDCGLILLVI